MADVDEVVTAPPAEVFSFAAVPRLSAALKRGEEEAFAWLHRAWAQRIYRYCFALAAGDETLAAEIAQSVWLRLMRHIRTLPDEAALWNWTACAARHAATDLRRKGGRYFRVLAHFARWWRPAPSEPAENAEEKLTSALESALNRLSATERDIIEARYFSIEPLAATAARHSLSTRAIEGRLARTRERLRRLIAEELQHFP